MDCAVERLIQAAGLGDPGEDGPGQLTVQEILRRQIAENAGDIAAGGARCRRVLIPEGDLVTGAGEADRPSAADEAAADDGDAAHQSASTLPSTPSDWPEMLAPASESRKATVAATS